MIHADANARVDSGQQSAFSALDLATPAPAPRQQPASLKTGNVALTRPIFGIERIGDDVLRAAAVRAGVAIFESERTNDESIAEMTIYDGVATMRVAGMRRVCAKALDPSSWNMVESESAKVGLPFFDAEVNVLSVPFHGSASDTAPQTEASVASPLADVVRRLAETRQSSRPFEPARPTRIVHQTVPGDKSEIVAHPDDDVAWNLASEFARAAVAEALWANSVKMEVQVFESQEGDQRGSYVASTKGLLSFDRRVLMPSLWSTCGFSKQFTSALAVRFDVPTNDLRIRIPMSVVETVQAIRRMSGDAPNDRFPMPVGFTNFVSVSSRKRKREEVDDSGAAFSSSSPSSLAIADVEGCEPPNTKKRRVSWSV